MGNGRLPMGAFCWLVCTLCACHQSDQLRGVKAAALLDESVLDFGNVPIGERHRAELHVRNVGYVPFNLLDIVRTGNDPSFEMQVDQGRVSPGETRSVLVTFHPLREMALSDSLTVKTDADRPADGLVTVRGRGTPTPIQFSPARLDYQTLEIDSDRRLIATVQNPVDLPLTVRLSGAHPGDFSSDVVTIPPFGRQTVNLVFSPHVLGNRLARLEVRSCSDCTASALDLVGRSVASAFEFDPAPVPFANIPVHERTQSSTRATNVTWRPVRVSRLTTSDDAFQPLTDLASQNIDANQSVEVRVEFAARASGPNTGVLNVDYQSDRERTSAVALDARGGQPELAVTPVLIDFGSLPVGGKVGRPVRLTNTGTTGPIHLRGVRATGDVAHFSISEPSRGRQVLAWSPGTAWPELGAPDLPIAPGSDYLQTIVYFQPDLPGDFRVRVGYLSDDRFNPERPLVAIGHAYQAGPCSYRILPANVLDFGDVPPGTGAVLGFRFENIGRTICAVRDIHLSNDAGGAFFMPGGPLAGGVVGLDDAFSAQIAFRTGTPGSYAGELIMTVNSLDQPTARLPLAALAQDSCLTATPNFLDFGAIRYDCTPVPLRTLVSNQCRHPITVTQVQIGPGTSDEFSIVNPPSTPLTLNTGEGFELQVTYARRVLGQHFSPLFIQAEGEPKPLLVPLLAETNHEGLRTERFVQGIANQLDALFVVGNTTTMQTYQDRLRAAIPEWISRANGLGVNIHVGVTSTGLSPRGPSCGGGAQGGENGRLFPIDNSRPRIVDSSTPGATALVQQNLGVGTCHNLLQGLEAIRQGLSPPLIDHAKDPRTPDPNDGNLGLLRPEARLAVVVLADEDDHSGFDIQSYVQFIHSLKGPQMSHRSSVSAIIPMDLTCTTAGPPGPRFRSVAEQTGGATLSVCQTDYSPILDRIATLSGGPQRDFRLSSTPADPTQIEVQVDDQTWDRTRWHFDEASNSVIFETGSIPNPGQVIAVRYRSTCGP